MWLTLRIVLCSHTVLLYYSNVQYKKNIRLLVVLFIYFSLQSDTNRPVLVRLLRVEDCCTLNFWSDVLIRQTITSVMRVKVLPFDVALKSSRRSALSGQLLFEANCAVTVWHPSMLVSRRGTLHSDSSTRESGARRPPRPSGTKAGRTPCVFVSDTLCLSATRGSSGCGQSLSSSGRRRGQTGWCPLWALKRSSRETCFIC